MVHPQHHIYGAGIDEYVQSTDKNSRVGESQSIIESMEKNSLIYVAFPSVEGFHQLPSSKLVQMVV